MINQTLIFLTWTIMTILLCTASYFAGTKDLAIGMGSLAFCSGCVTAIYGYIHS